MREFTRREIFQIQHIVQAAIARQQRAYRRGTTNRDIAKRASIGMEDTHKSGNGFTFPRRAVGS